MTDVNTRKPNDGGFAERMTLRDWFAGQAMMGFCADPTNHKVFANQGDAALAAYSFADAMLLAREELA